MSGTVVVRRCASAEEAAIVCALLNDAGIPASLENWHHAMINWGAIPALGGVGVHVPQEDGEAAREIIIEYAETADERLLEHFADLEAGPAKPKRFRRPVLLAYYSGALLIPLVVACMLTEVFARAILYSSTGELDWAIVRAELYAAHWTYFIIYIIGAALYFLVPLSVFVRLGERFLARRTAQKAIS